MTKLEKSHFSLQVIFLYMRTSIHTDTDTLYVKYEIDLSVGDYLS